MAKARQIQLRSDTYSNFSLANPLLLSGEMALELDTGRFKVGDGSNNYNDLDYFTTTSPSVLPTYTTLQLPIEASWPSAIAFHDNASVLRPIYCDGTNWRFMSDNSIVS